MTLLFQDASEVLCFRVCTLLLVDVRNPIFRGRSPVSNKAEMHKNNSPVISNTNSLAIVNVGLTLSSIMLPELEFVADGDAFVNRQQNEYIFRRNFVSTRRFALNP